MWVSERLQYAVQTEHADGCPLYLTGNASAMQIEGAGIGSLMYLTANVGVCMGSICQNLACVFCRLLPSSCRWG